MSPDRNIASVLTFLSVYSKVFSFVQTLTGCEDQAKLFRDEVRRAGEGMQAAQSSCLPTEDEGISHWPSFSGFAAECLEHIHHLAGATPGVAVAWHSSV